MAYTQDDVTNLEKAIASGLQQAMQGGEMVQYRSLKEMRQIVKMMKDDIVAGTPTTMSYPQTKSGW